MKNPKNIPRFRFTEDEPTPIVGDFKAFIDYTENTQFALGKGGKIPFKHLVALNEMMSSPNRENTPRTPQQYYPRLHLFYHLSLAGSLFQRAQGGSSVVLEPAERLDDFRSLSDAGKYFFLLETLYVDCPLGVFTFGSRREDSVGAVYGMRFFLETLSKMEPDKEASDVPSYAIVSPLGDSLFLCLQFFGWHNFVRDTEHSRTKSWVRLKSLTPSLLGVTISEILLEERPPERWNLPFRLRVGEMVDYPGQDLEDEKSEYVPFAEAFRKICEDEESLTSFPRAKRKHVKGNFIFKVSLGDIWRTIAISSEDTLHHLHEVIQDAFRFDNDHLYAFYMDDRKWSDYKYEHPFSDEGPWATEVLIGDLDLLVNQSILYLFDFGDEWTFDVNLLEIRTDEPLLHKAKTTKRKGKSPEQYPYYEDF
jgi:hypothetical protein